MFWDEQFAIAGNIVEEMEGGGDESDDIVLYSNYVTT